MKKGGIKIKLNINNKTNLSFNLIGEIYDKWIEKGKDRMVTIYDGMKEYELFEYKKVQYKMTIEHKTTCISILVEELDIEAKEVSTKGIKLPKLPKKKEVK